MTTPFASIIVPTYNQADYIGEALDSILAQTDPSWEAIVVNDGSTDDTAKIIDAYAARDPRFKIVHKANGGVASALNEGLARARGRWVHWLSSDDMFEPTKLATNREWIRRHPEAKFFFSYFTLLREATGQRERRELWGPVPHPEHQILTLFYRNPISGISICVDREAWLEVGTFNDRFHYAQDYDQWLRLLQRHQGVFIPEWTVINRNHAAQGSEVFPDACYFDTAKAGLNFLNRYSFPELVPHADLTNPERATAAVGAALTFAADPTSFIYALGPTPALVLRVLEWVYGENNHQAARKLALNRVVAEALREGDDAFRWMWRALAAAVTQDNPRFVYDPSDHLQLARTLHAGLIGVDEKRAAALRTYLRRFDGVEISQGGEKPIDQGTIVINAAVGLQPDTGEAARLGAEALAARGHWPVLVAPQQESYRWRGGVAQVRQGAHDVDVLPWLADATVGVGVGTARPGWLQAKTNIHLPASEAGSVEESVVSALGGLTRAAGQQSVRTVVFLQRVLRGGGAERVVREIATHLDRTRYRPFVLTLYEDGPDPNYPPGIPVINVRRFLQEHINTPEPALPKEEAPAATAASEAPATEITVEPDRFEWLKAQIKRSRIATRIARRTWSLLRRARDDAGVLRQRAVLRLVTVGRAVSHRLLGPIRPVPLAATEMAAQATARPSAAMQDFTYRHSTFLKALDHHWPAAEGLRILMSHLGSNVALIPVMEEATVAAWLAQHVGKIPYLASLHILESRYLRMIYPDRHRFEIEHWIFANACRNAEMVVFPSTGCAHDLRSFAGVDERALGVIGNPVACARVRREAFAPADTPRREPGGSLFVSVGRLDAQKGQDLLLAAFARHRESNPRARLVVIGDGGERAALLARRAELGLDAHVDFIGALENPFPIVRQSDALILSSRFESFALVLVEAMICGVPVISFDCPFGPADVLGGGKYGLLVPPEDIDGLAAAMARILEDEALRRDLVERGYTRALDFDVSTVTRRWEELIDRVFAPTQPAHEII